VSAAVAGSLARNVRNAAFAALSLLFASASACDPETSDRTQGAKPPPHSLPARPPSSPVPGDSEDEQPATPPEPPAVDAGRDASGQDACAADTNLARAAQAPACAEAERRCSYRFKYADRGETSIEVRGNFKADGWKSGVPMTKRGSTWTADVEVPIDKDVEYKFVIDGTRWTRDPANSTAVGVNGNSLLEALRCSPHVCASH
jgi:hypothetical protein